ncbi:hypothetical protein [Clostridium sp. chh4-2]|nr:hypothetical protein [Clostridium sp. chh4-2]
MGKVRTEPGARAGRKQSEGGTGPGKKDTDEWDSGFAPKNY